ncbi:MAG TPA: cytochrome c biogenesis protein CcdA [Gemmatimonadales bacterium]
MNHRSRLAAGVAAPLGALMAGLILLPARAGAQEHPVTWSLASPRKSVRQGEKFTALLRADIPGGWHLYSLTEPPDGPVATAISLAAGGSFVLVGRPSARNPDVQPPDNNFPVVTETYGDSVTFVNPVAARSAGNETLNVKVYYETCTDRYCLPPTTDVLQLRLRVTPGAAVALAVAPPPPPPPPQSRVSRAPAAAPGGTPGGSTTQSLPLFLWLAAVMGGLSLLTPCVFPMIPITVSYFTRTNETARGKPARNALIYAGGIMATFTVLGMAIAVLVGAGGINRFAANPWINLLVTGIFIAFACNLFGAYQIALPASLLTRLDRVTRRAGGNETAGIVLMGLTFTLTSFTCTAPFVGTLLVMAARGSWLWPLGGLLVFSAVFALPFFLLALMPSAVARLPRAGSWLQSVKVMMGFVELATAMKFLSNADLVLRWGVFTRTVVLLIWLGIALVAAGYLLGGTAWWRRGLDRRPGAGRIVAAVATLAIAAYIGRGLGGRRLGELESFVPPPEGGVISGVASVPGELSWLVNDYPAGMAQARAEHKQVMVDFTGYTCTNCRWMEANMFPRNDVKAQLRRFVRVRLYTDGQGELYQRQQRMEQEKLGTVALPYYAIVDTLGDVKAQFLGMTRHADEFVQFLSHGRSSTAP